MEFLQGVRRFSDWLHETFCQQVAGNEFSQVSFDIVVFMDVFQGVEKPVVDIHASSFSASYHGVHHCSIFGSVVIAAEEITVFSDGNGPGYCYLEAPRWI